MASSRVCLSFGSDGDTLKHVEPHPGCCQGLCDLVVQHPCDPLALALLCHDKLRGKLAQIVAAPLELLREILQIHRALPDPLLQGLVGLPQCIFAFAQLIFTCLHLVGHGIEGICQILQFRLATDPDFLQFFPAPEGKGKCPQSRDWTGDFPGKGQGD